MTGKHVAHDSYGDVDGEMPDVAVVRFSGAGRAHRPLYLGERVAYTIVGVVTSIGFKRTDDALVRVHTVRLETSAEPYDQLATDVWEYLRAVHEADTGQPVLPLDEADDAGDVN